jgi:hypothetical protein
LYWGVKKHVLVGYFCELGDYNRFYPAAGVSRQHENPITLGTGADPPRPSVPPDSYKTVPEILKKVRKNFPKFCKKFGRICGNFQNCP